MVVGKAIGSADYTNMHNIDSSLTTSTTFGWTVTAVDTDHATGQKEYTWQSTKWTDYLGYSREVPELAAFIEKAAIWATGSGFTVGKTAYHKRFTENVRGSGKQSFEMLMDNAVRTFMLNGDAFFEIVRDKQNRPINLKAMNPAAIRIVYGSDGMLKRYEQTANLPTGQKQIIKFDPENMLHFAWNQMADEVHGTSLVQKVESLLKMIIESRNDLKVIFHRYAKPLIIIKTDTADTSKIAAFKAKLDKAIELGENMVIPNTAVDLEKMSIPQYSTLDPLPWQKHLMKTLIQAAGVPGIILGASGEEDTEASSKMVILGFEELVRFIQKFLETNLKLQVGIDIKYKFDASIRPSLLSDNKKDGSPNTASKMQPGKQS